MSEQLAERLAGAGRRRQRRAPRHGARVSGRGGPPGRRARRRARAGRLAAGAAPGHPAPHRGRHRRRRRRLERPAARGARRPARRATCGWRWPRWPATTTGARTWERLLQHRFAGAGPARRPRRRQPAARRPHRDRGRRRARRSTSSGGCSAAAGRVLPASREPLEICAPGRPGCDPDPQEAARCAGQVAVATTPGSVSRRLAAARRTRRRARRRSQAVLDADWVVLGPGSWFTSVLPHLLVPGPARGPREDAAPSGVVALNLAPQAGETAGFSPEAHLDVLLAHAAAARPRRRARGRRGGRSTPVLCCPRWRPAAARLVLAAVALGDGTPRHDPARLGAAYHSIFSGAAWR